MPEAEMTIDVYAVGVLSALKHEWGCVVRARRRPRYLRRCVKYLAYQALARNWRAIRMAFNGYLAEPSPCPVELRECGHGWTKRRALKRLRKNMEKANDEHA